MNKIGRKIYFEKSLGNVIIDTGERQGSVIATTIEQDIATFTALSERNRDTFDVLELPFGYLAQDFAECNGYWVNVEKLALEFSYPDPEQPEAPPLFQKPLTSQLAELKQQTQQMNEDLLALSEYVTTL